MARIARLPARFMFAAAVLTSFGFGVTQAFATPPAPSATEARVCDPNFCYWVGPRCYCN